MNMRLPHRFLRRSMLVTRRWCMFGGNSTDEISVSVLGDGLVYREEHRLLVVQEQCVAR